MQSIDSVLPPAPDDWGFIEELRRPEKRPLHWTRNRPRTGEADFSRGVTLNCGFEDPLGTLETAYQDWRSFYPFGRGSYEIRTGKGECGPYDSFRMVITPESCRIIAGNCEGIRRGLYYLQDLLLGAEGPFLPVGEIHRKAWLENRISRCFFGPIKRPPANRDELADEVDYYPEAYLSRLAGEGVNGLWLTVTFADLIDGPEAELRFAKLERTVDKCLRYGIKTWLFMIEPAGRPPAHPFFRKHPDLMGAATLGGNVCVCPSSAAGRKYLYESTRKIFSRVPRLGGIINISNGERDTTCLSALGVYGEHPCDCPVCSRLKPQEILFNSVDAMNRGMKSASPEAQFISWIYHPHEAPESPLFADISSRVPAGVTLLFNFESGIAVEQQGKLRIGGDYWQSQVGPSERFLNVAGKLDPNAKLGAKLQVGCSHEAATLPYIPVPGLLYRKYRKLHELGATTVMQCWYFGNYPGLMNKAAGWLAFEDFSRNEADFLLSLAAPEWGADAPAMAAFWQQAGDAYSHYPLDTIMQYYGPFHDGVVWPLYPTTQYLPLSATWQVCYPTSGDNIVDALGSFTLSEAAAQTALMARGWRRALKQLDPIRGRYRDVPERRRDLELGDAMGILLDSGANIFRFYKLRAEGGKRASAMRKIMLEEAENSEKMALLCEHDCRLGFHSEAEGYKFFPEKLRVRAGLLREYAEHPPAPLTETPVPAFTAEFRHAATFDWRLSETEDQIIMEITLHGRRSTDLVSFAIAGRPEEPFVAVEQHRSGTFLAINCKDVEHSMTECGEDWNAVFRLPKACLPPGDCFRLALTRYQIDPAGTVTFDSVPERPEAACYYRLRHGLHHPRYMICCRRDKIRKPEKSSPRV